MFTKNQLKHLIFCLFFSLQLYGQTPTDLRTEKIFLTTPKTDYTIDDTITVRGLATSIAHNHSTPYSRFVYVELLNPDVDSVIARNKAVIDHEGRFHTSFTPEPDAVKGGYFLRAYTRFMRNFSESSFAFHYITIGKADVKDDGIIDENVSCEIVPTGNKLIPGLPQQIVCVLNNHLGYPLRKQTLALTGEKGDTIALSTTSDAGFAVFNFIPTADRTYTVKFSAMGVNKLFDVPDANENESKISAALKGNRLYFNIEGQSPKKRQIFAFDNNNGLSQIDATADQGLIKLSNTPTGPVTVFLTDDTLGVISQCSILPGDALNLALNASDTLNTNSKTPYKIEGLHEDSITTMVRFVPVSSSVCPPSAQQAILFSSDFQSPLPFPSATGNRQQINADMQAWLGTATFTRFNLAEAVKNDCDLYRYLPEFNQTISGTIYDDKRAKHPMKYGKLVAYNGFDRSVTDTTVTKDGRFIVEVNDFDDGSEFFLQAINSNEKIINAIIELDAVDYPEIGILPVPPVRRNKYNEADVSIGESGKGVRELPNIVVKARAQRIENRNDKNIHSIRMKDRDEIVRKGYLTLFDIVRDMPFLRIVAVEDVKAADDAGKDAGRSIRNSAPGQLYYYVYTTRGTSSLSGNNSLPIIVDGTVWDVQMCASLWDMPAAEIESVKQLSVAESLLYSAKGLYGALAIQTRTLGNKPRESKGRRCWPEGITPTLATDYHKGPRTPAVKGEYNMFVDIVTKDGRVYTLSKPVTVID